MDKINPSSQSSKEKKASLDVVSEVKSDLSRYREQFEKCWKEEEDSYYGKVWKDQDGYRPVENFMFQTVESEVPILTDAYPATTVKVDDPAYLKQAENLNKAVKWVYEDQDFQLKLPMVIRSSLMSAPGFIHPYYDANAKNGQGEIVHEVVPWTGVWLHGGALFVEKAESARIELFRSRSWLKVNYPNFAKEIDSAKGEASGSNSDRGSETRDSGNGYAKRKRPEPYKDKNTLKLVKTFLKDYTIEPIPTEETAEQVQSELAALGSGEGMDVAKWQDHKAHIEAHLQDLEALYNELGVSSAQGFEEASKIADVILQESPESGAGDIVFKIKLLENHIEEHKVLSKENPQGGRLKYPNALRCIETVGDIVLHDGPSRDKHCEIPLVPFYCYRDSTIYGFGEIRNILDSQRMHSVLQYKEYKGLQLVMNPSIIVDQESGLTEDDVSNEDGAVYVVPQGTGLRHLEPGHVSTQAGNFNNERKRSIADISGVNEATQGRMPAPNASGVTVERTQQQAIGRIRLKDRQNQKYSIKRLGKLTASLILQYWTEEKTLKLEDVGGDHQQIVFNPLEMEDMEYEIDIAPGSMAGIDKDSFNAMLMQFLKGGHLTFDEVLQVGEFPRKEQILELYKQRNDTNSQLQQIQMENIKLKAQISPELLTPEEAQMFEDMTRQELLEQQMGAANGQPVA